VMRHVNTKGSTMKRVFLGAMIISFGAACGAEAPKTDPAAAPGAPVEAEAAAPLDPRVAKAVEVADAIASAPEDADAILEKHGLDRDKLDAMLFEIARDPALSAAYKTARGG
jgi:hypothetical protein